MLAHVGVSIAIIMYHTEAITLKELGIMSHTLNVRLVLFLFLYTTLPIYQNGY